jgi:Protein of unknown function (DUF3486)
VITNSARREGRGRLSSIDQLPDACEPDIVWALEQLEARKAHSNAILKEFNARIADKGAGKISPQAWNRWSIRKALQLRRMQEGRAIMSGIHGALPTDNANDEITLVLGEMIKLAVFEQLEAGTRGENRLDEKQLGNLSRTLRHAVKAQVDTLEFRQAKADFEERMKKTAEAVESLGKNGLVGAATLEKITNLLKTGAA